MHRRLGVKIDKFRQKRCETSLRQIAVGQAFVFVFIFLCVCKQTKLQQIVCFPTAPKLEYEKYHHLKKKKTVYSNATGCQHHWRG